MHEEGQRSADNAEGCILDGMKRGDAIRGGLCISHAKRTHYTSDLHNTAGRPGTIGTRSTQAAADTRAAPPISDRSSLLFTGRQEPAAAGT